MFLICSLGETSGGDLKTDQATFSAKSNETETLDDVRTSEVRGVVLLLCDTGRNGDWRIEWQD